MAITLSARRLSTVTGQEGIVAAINLEKTLDKDADVNFKGDPSLRILLVDDVAKWPYSDALFQIQLEVRQHRYEDGTARDKWLTDHLPQVKSPQALATWCNQNVWDAHTHLYGKQPRPLELIDAALPHMSTQVLENILEHTTDSEANRKKKYPNINLRMLRHLLGREDSNTASVCDISKEFIHAAWASDRRQWVPAVIHMVNTFYRKKMGEYNAEKLSDLFDSGWEFLKITREPGKFMTELHDPHAFDYAAWRQWMHSENGRGGDND